jgi:hypothetical protein
MVGSSNVSRLGGPGQPAASDNPPAQQDDPRTAALALLRDKWTTAARNGMDPDTLESNLRFDGAMQGLSDDDISGLLNDVYSGAGQSRGLGLTRQDASQGSEGAVGGVGSGASPSWFDNQRLKSSPNDTDTNVRPVGLTGGGVPTSGAQSNGPSGAMSGKPAASPPAERPVNGFPVAANATSPPNAGGTSSGPSHSGSVGGAASPSHTGKPASGPKNTPAAYPGGYAATATSTTVGANYANTVQHLVDKLRAGDIETDQLPGYCAREIRVLQDANGNEQYWPQGIPAYKLVNALATPQYSQHWTRLTGVNSLQDAPQGTICVWGNEVGQGNGHVGIVWHQNIVTRRNGKAKNGVKTYLLGNFDGKSFKDVAMAGGSFQQADAYYLPALPNK